MVAIYKNNKILKLFILLFSLQTIFLFCFLPKKKNLKIALCTMGKKENLYVKEFIDYYIKLGVNHIFIYDDNDINTERIKDVINPLIIM